VNGMTADVARNSRPAPGSPRSNLVWCYFNKCDVYEGVLLRSGKSGAYFESAVEPLVGSTILMRLKGWHAPPRHPFSHLRSIALAKVECCREIRCKQKFGFGVSIRYYECY
jgi:hypothetical protein